MRLVRRISNGSPQSNMIDNFPLPSVLPTNRPSLAPSPPRVSSTVPSRPSSLVDSPPFLFPPLCSLPLLLSRRKGQQVRNLLTPRRPFSTLDSIRPTLPLSQLSAPLQDLRADPTPLTFSSELRFPPHAQDVPFSFSLLEETFPHRSVSPGELSRANPVCPFSAKMTTPLSW